MTRRVLPVLPWVALVALALGISTGDAYLVTLGIVTAIWGVLAVGLNLLMGYTGLIHLGLGAFYALGAYGTAILTVDRHWPAWLMLLVMPLAAFVVAVLTGPALLRTRGLYFAVATLGLGVIVSNITGNWISVTKGPLGFAGIERPPGFQVAGLDVDPAQDRTFFFLSFAVLLACIGLATAYHRSRTARILIATRDDELLASSLGLDPLPYRLFAFGASSAVAALAGVLYAWFILYISPGPFSFFSLSFPVFVLVAVGGPGSVWGPVVGAVFLTGLPELIDLEPHTKIIVYGVVLLAVIVLLPRGLVPSASDALRHLPRRRRAEPPRTTPSAPALSSTGRR